MIEPDRQAMDNKNLEKKMEFIIEQQAQLVVNQEKADERMTRIEDIVGRLGNVTLNGFENVEAKISALVDAQIKTEANIGKMAAAQEQMAEAQKQMAEAQTSTDERLNLLINVVERQISEGRNGNA